jgi:preprotein translocase subunit YajC
MLKKDNLSLGIVLGLITPLVAFFLYYFFLIRPHNNIGLGQFFSILKDNRQMLPKIVSICLLLNGFVFFLYTRTRKDITAKGIFLMTMLYAIAILLLKLIR